MSRVTCNLEKESLLILNDLASNETLRRSIKTLRCRPTEKFFYRGLDDTSFVDLMHSVEALPNLQIFHVSYFCTKAWFATDLSIARRRYCKWYHSVLETLSKRPCQPEGRMSLLVEMAPLDLVLKWCLPEQNISSLVQNVTHVSISVRPSLGLFDISKQTYAWAVILEQARHLRTLELRMDTAQHNERWRTEVQDFLEVCLLGQHWPKLSSILLEANVDEHILASLLTQHCDVLEEIVIRSYVPVSLSNAVTVLQDARQCLTELKSAQLMANPCQEYHRGIVDGDWRWYDFVKEWANTKDTMGILSNKQYDIGNYLIRQPTVQDEGGWRCEGYSTVLQKSARSDSAMVWTEVPETDYAESDRSSYHFDPDDWDLEEEAIERERRLVVDDPVLKNEPYYYEEDDLDDGATGLGWKMERDEW